jgi:hypothetical protein
MGRQKDDRYGCRFFESQMRGFGHNERCQRRDMRPEAAGGDGDDFVTRLKAFHPFTHRHNPPGTFVTEHHIIAAVSRIKTQSLHDVAEIQGRGTDLDLNLSWARPLPSRFA